MVRPAPWESEWIESPRRVGVRFGGEWLASSTRMMLLRQHGFLPVYYFPAEDVRADLLVPTDYVTESPYKGTATYWNAVVGERVAPWAAWSYLDPKPRSPDTRGYYSFDWHSMDAWYEEGERVYVHARDPYLRTDAIPSRRHVQIDVGGTLVADTRQPVLLFETGLVTRYYVPPEDVRMNLLQPSETFTLCPYKGRASYYHLSSGDELFEDVAWQYRQPLPDVAAAAGHLCFWTERADTAIVVDGEPVEPLGTRDNGDGGELLTPMRRFISVPPPESMRNAGPGERQHDFSRPNGRAEGPPDAVIDLAVERAGGRVDDWVAL
jgi:uncharacterized protein (DUF427 family)